MYRLLIGLVVSLTLVMFATTSARAQSLKVGLVDFEQVLRSSAAAKRELKKLKRKLAPKKRRLKDKLQALDALRVDIQKKAKAGARPETIRRLSRKLDRGTAAYNRRAEKLRREEQAWEDNLVRRLLKKARDIVVRIAKRRGLMMVLDSKAVVWTSGGDDLTYLVSAQLK